MKGSRKGAGFGLRTEAPARVAVKNRGDLISYGKPTDLILIAIGLEVLFRPLWICLGLGVITSVIRDLAF